MDEVVDKLTGDTRYNISVVPVKIWKIEDELFSEIVSPTRNRINRLDYLLLPLAEALRGRMLTF